MPPKKIKLVLNHMAPHRATNPWPPPQSFVFKYVWLTKIHFFSHRASNMNVPNKICLCYVYRRTFSKVKKEFQTKLTRKRPLSNCFGYLVKSVALKPELIRVRKVRMKEI